MAAAPPSTRYATTLAVSAAAGGFLFGFDTSSMNSAINGIRSTLALDAGAVGFVVAILLIGCAIGAWFAGPVAARVGRPLVMWLAGLLIALGSLGTAMSGRAPLLGVCRLVVGLGIGGASAVVPAYIAEISPTRIRGRLGTSWQFAIVIGQFLGLLAGYLLTRRAGAEAAPLWWGAAAWRWMFVAVAVPAAAYVLVARRLPQSPPDLLRHGRDGEARALLVRLGAEAVDAEIERIRHSLAEKRRSDTLGVLRGPRLGLRAVVWTGLFLAAFQQLVGINVVKTYSNALWQRVGFSTGASFTVSMLTVLLSVASTVVAIAVMDRVGRRTLLLGGAAVMAAALATLAVALPRGAQGGAGLAALAAMNLFAVAFGVSWGPVMWLMLGELFDSSLRTPAVALCTAVNWLTNWAVTRTFPLLAGAGLGIAYGLYAVFALAAFVFVLRRLPETRGRALA